METQRIRYGASYDFTIETDDLTSETATFLVGKEGEAPLITSSATFTDGIAEISVTPEETQIPLGEYKYQINVETSDGKVYKYPDIDDCETEDSGLPIFIVLEALDETEVVS